MDKIVRIAGPSGSGYSEMNFKPNHQSCSVLLLILISLNIFTEYQNS